MICSGTLRCRGETGVTAEMPSGAVLPSGTAGPAAFDLDRTLRCAADAAPVPLAVYDLDGHARYVNRAYTLLTGFDLEELRGRTFLDTVHPDDRDRARPLWGAARGGAAGSIREYRVAVAHGRDVHLSSSFSPVGDDPGAPGAVLVRSGETLARRGQRVRRLMDSWYSVLFEQAPVGIVGVSRSGRIMFANEAAARTLGYTREEFLTLSIPDIDVEVTGEDYTRYREALLRGERPQFQARHRRKDGSFVEVEVRIGEFTHGGERVVFGLWQDITERVRDLEARRRSEERFKKVFDQSSDGILITDAQTGEFVETNATMCDLLGYGREELLGLGLGDIHPPEELPLILEKFARAVRENRYFAVDVPMQRKDGSRFFADVGHTTIVEDGRPRGVGVFRDTTERKALNARIARDVAERQAILENVHVGIGLLKQGRFVWFNSAMEQLFDHLGNEAADLVAGIVSPATGHSPRLDGVVREALAAGERYGVERLVTRRDGRRFWCAIVGTAIDAADPEGGSIWIVQDISERHEREREQALERSRLRRVATLSLKDFTTFENFIDEALAEVAELVESPYGFFGLYTEDPPEMRNIAFTRQAKRDTGIPAAPGTFPVDTAGIWAEVVRRRSAVLINDFAAANPLKLGFPAGHIAINRFLSIPIFSGERIVALAAVANKPEDYQPADVRQLTLLMEALWEIGRRKQAELELRRSREQVMSINSELEDRVRLRTSELAVLSRRLMDVQEEERRHLARELHDEVGQALTGIRLGVENLATHLPPERQEEGKGLIANVGELLAGVRRISLDLRPSILDDFGLVPALKWYFSRVAAASGFHVAFECRVGRAQPDRRVETALFRIVQEAITNARRHAGVKEAEVLLSIGKVAKVQVRDRGAGFVCESWNLLHDSSGLSGMSERTMLLGGRFKVVSKPGQGTRITAVIPLDDRAQQHNRERGR